MRWQHLEKAELMGNSQGFAGGRLTLLLSKEVNLQKACFKVLSPWKEVIEIWVWCVQQTSARGLLTQRF
ncbi:MAG: hypothetical protein HLUCCA11_20430 [Phormidesmis priestleyi Ana]|uniref:Uncharacterized protein n=1 Tax=Phormidesmis priestleyi Ana TaxID=1666911 RepID=A0A0P7YR96_9CYAN|nr:MAG: hypothetical protein HLUCCA11_20430 [Phormidesmis priestleyi Ana]